MNANDIRKMMPGRQPGISVADSAILKAVNANTEAVLLLIEKLGK